MEIKESDARQNVSRIFGEERLSRREFFHRVLMVVGVVVAVGLLLALLLALLWQSTEVILLIFAGLLLAIFLRAIAERISQHTPLSENWALTVVLLAIVGAIALLVWLMMPSLENQYGEISRQLPQTVENLRQRLGQYAAGRWILEQMPTQPSEFGNQTSNVFGRITGFFSSFLGIVVNVAPSLRIAPPPIKPMPLIKP